MTTPEPWTLKKTLDFGKSVGTAVIVLATVATSVYSGFFKTEQDARTGYNTLRPVVQDTANDMLALRLRLDVYEKLLFSSRGCPDAAPASPKKDVAEETGLAKPRRPDTTRHSVTPSQIFAEIVSEQSGRGVPEYGDAVQKRVRLPEAPWSQQKK
jgi:hypothetical protein